MLVISFRFVHGLCFSHCLTVKQTVWTSTSQEYITWIRDGLSGPPICARSRDL